MRRAVLLLIGLMACSEDTTVLDGGGEDASAVEDSGANDAGTTDSGGEILDAAAKDADPADADPADADPADADPTDADPSDAASSDGGRTCEQIEQEYQALVSNTRCDVETECQVVNGHCAVGLGGCWYVINDSVMQSALDALAAEYVARRCTSGVCACIAPPNAVTCNQGTCAPLP